MPELPEVESARRGAQRRLAGKCIVGVYAARDPIVFAGVSPRAVRAALCGRTILGFQRKGKYLWMTVEDCPCVLFHFGMTGGFHFYTDAADRPQFCKLELVTDDGRRFAMTDKRRFGRIRLVEDPIHSPPVSCLGWDVLSDRFGPSEILPLLHKRKAPIKAVLLDQILFAGVGNWIADEMLYQAAVDPRRPACRLTPQQVVRLCRCLKRIVKKSVDVDADYTQFPKNWLFHYRWGRNSHAVDYRGRKIRFTRIGGRTTAWVPAKQAHPG